MNGPSPPSSIDALRIPGAAWASSVDPTPVEPVKLILRSRGSAISAADTAEDDVVCTRLTTPAGKPASRSVSTNNAQVSGVSLADFTITGQPAARAAPALRAIINIGKFHG